MGVQVFPDDRQRLINELGAAIVNPAYFGDSYDLVKRFFCGQLSALGYEPVVDPMFTGNWGELEGQFFHLIGAVPPSAASTAPRRALFVDPDTGVNNHGSFRHVSIARLAAEAANYALVFSFDQSFSRKLGPHEIMVSKLSAIRSHGCHAMYYDSHARFLFVARELKLIEELRGHLLSIGLPAARLLQSGT